MSASESSLALPLTPQERLERIQDFLTTVHSIRMERVWFATILAPLVDEETAGLTKQGILQDIQGSIGVANEALRELREDTKMQLLVQKPGTGEFAPLNLLGITNDKLTYMGRVLVGNNLVAEWDIGAAPLLHLK